MYSIEIIVKDNKGNVIKPEEKKIYDLDVKGKTFYEIEGAVEKFKKKILPDIEKDLLEEAQKEFIEEKKIN